MKIAFIYDAIYPFVKGGVEKRVMEVSVRLARRGHEVHLFGMKFWGGGDEVIRDGVRLHGVCPAVAMYSGKRRSLWQPLYFSVALLGALGRETFDIIDCQQFPYFSCFSSRFISAVKRIPLVITWHEPWGRYWFEYLGWKGIGGVWAERIISRLTPYNIAVSRTSRDNLAAMGARQEIHIIPNGIDLEEIHRIAPSGSVSDIIYVGRLIPEKHVDLLIRAFSSLLTDKPGLRLVIIGDGPEHDTIAKTIDEYAVRGQVELLGFRDDYNEIIARMKSSRVFVLPSTREGFGIAALEALACGLPVVTIDHPANAVLELMNGTNGFLCRLSARDLASTISVALERHESMRDSCIRSAEPFDWEAVTSDLEALYRRVSRESGKKPGV